MSCAAANLVPTETETSPGLSSRYAILYILKKVKKPRPLIAKISSVK